MSIRDRFILVLTKGIDPERSVALLRDVEQSVAPDDKNLEKAVSRLENAPKREYAYGRIMLCALLIISGAFLLLSHTAVIVFGGELLEVVAFKGQSTKKKSKYSEGDKAIIDSCYSLQSAYDLWQNEPQNPSLFANYVNVHYSQRRDFPAEMVDLAAEIDPDNSYFAMLKLAELSKGIVERNNDGSAGEHVFKIVDEDAYEMVVLGLKQALSLPEFDKRQIAYSQMRMDAILSRGYDDYVSRLDRMASHVTKVSYPLMIRYLGDLHVAKLERLVMQGSKDEINWWLERSLNLLGEEHKSAFTILDLLILKSNIKNQIATLKAMAEMSGNKETSQRVDQIQGILYSEKARLEEVNYDTYLDEHFTEKLGVMAGIAVPVSARWSNPSLAQVSTSRYVEHALLDRVITVIAWLICCFILLLIFGYRFTKGGLRDLGLKLCGVLSILDWTVIYAIGVMFPLFVFWIIHHHTSLSIREWNVMAHSGWLAMLQYTAMVLSMISCSVIVVRWRLHGLLESIVRRPSWYALAAAVTALLAIFTSGMCGYEWGIISYITVVLLGFSLGFLLTSSFRFCFKDVGDLGKLAVNRALVPVFGIIVLCLCILNFVFYQQEKKWLAQDDLLNLDATGAGMTVYENQVIQELKKKLGEQVDILTGK